MRYPLTTGWFLHLNCTDEEHPSQPTVVLVAGIGGWLTCLRA